MNPQILDRLEEMVGSNNVLCEPEGILAFECNEFACHRHTTDAVVSGNPGSLLQIKHGLPWRKPQFMVPHPIERMDQTYSAES